MYRLFCVFPTLPEIDTGQIKPDVALQRSARFLARQPIALKSRRDFLPPKFGAIFKKRQLFRIIRQMVMDTGKDNKSG